MAWIKSQCTRLLLILVGALLVVAPFWYDGFDAERMADVGHQARSRWANILPRGPTKKKSIVDVAFLSDPMATDSYPEGMKLLLNVVSPLPRHTHGDV